LEDADVERVKILIIIKEVGWKVVGRVLLVQPKNNRWAYLSGEVKLGVPQNANKFLGYPVTC